MKLSRTVLDDVKGGLVASTTCLAFSVANGALIYTGTLQPMLRVGIAAGLLTTAVTAIVLALTSTFRPVIATANSATAAPLGAIMVSLAPSLAALPQATAAATVYGLVALTTLTTGLFLVVLGSARLGRIVRFLPFPVVAGFMGVTGTLLVLGSIRFGTGVRVVWAELPRFLAPDTAILLASTTAFAAILSTATRRFKHPLVLPGLLLAAILVTDAATFATGHSIEAPPLQGLFLVPHAAVPLDLLPIRPLIGADWALVTPHLGAIVAYAVLVLMVTLLTSSGLESALDVDADYDRELRTEGLACLVCGLCGGFVGNPSVGATAAGVSTGARGRLAGITNGILMLVVMTFGLPLLVFVPRFVIAGFLAHIGAWIIVTWCIATRRKMPRGEWLVVIGIVAVTIWAGMVAAIVAGLIAGCILLALDMSRIGVVRRDYGPDRRASGVVRSREELACLAQAGHTVRFVELHGMLFFGSAYRILTRIRELVATGPLDMIVLDLTSVTGCDSSTTAIIARMRRILTRERIAFAIVGGSARVVAMLETSACLLPGDTVYADRDRALEDAERLVLERSGGDRATARTMKAWLTDVLGDEAHAVALIDMLVGFDRSESTYLCRQGDLTQTLLFIESGRVEVMVGPPDNEVRVRVLGPQTITGEHGFILGLPRTASLKVGETARVWELQRYRFERLVADNPALAMALMRDIIRVQSERLSFATRQNAAFF